MFKVFYDVYISLHLGGTLSAILSTLSSVCVLGVFTYILHVAVRYTLADRLKKSMKKFDSKTAKIFSKYSLIPNLLHLLVPIIFYVVLPIFFDGETLEHAKKLLSLTTKACVLYFIILVGVLINSLLNVLEGIYNLYPVRKQWPIRSYMQFSKVFFFILMGVLIVAYIMDKSPLALLTGLGAALAVIGFVFKDSILSFVSSIQLASSDMIRVGDWIEIPSQDICGSVQEMSLNTIKIQNFDKTISTLPPYYLVGNAVKNWRGMFETGGRRIKRSFLIDIHTIKPATLDLIQTLDASPLLSPFISTEKERLLKSGTNLELFRAYINAYLIERPDIHKDGFMCMCRLLESQENGQPIEIYAYTTDTYWPHYENIQAQIFEHLMVRSPEFDLTLYQEK